MTSALPTSPPPRSLRWSGLHQAARAPRGATALAQGSVGFLMTSLGPCLVLLSRDLAIPRGRLSWLSSGFGVGLILAGLAGEQVLRLGARRLLRAAACAIAAGGILLAAAASLPAAQGGALLLGLGAAAVMLVSPVLLAGPRAAADLTFANAMNASAGIAAPLLLSAAEAGLGRGRLALLLPLPALLWLAASRLPAPARAVAPEPPRARSPVRSRLAAARASLALVGAIAPEFFFVVWGAARLQDSGLGAAAASASAAAFPIGLAAGRLVVPRLLGRIPVIGAGVALALAGALLCAAPVGPVLTTAALALAGLGISPLNPMLVDQLVRTPGLDLGRAAALGALASGAAVLGAPLFLSALASAVSLRLGFLAAVPLLAAVLLLHRRERPHGGGAESDPRPA